MEIWKDIINYEGYYQASNFGKIKSLERIVENSSTGNGTQIIKVSVQYLTAAQ